MNRRAVALSLASAAAAFVDPLSTLAARAADADGDAGPSAAGPSGGGGGSRFSAQPGSQAGQEQRGGRGGKKGGAAGAEGAQEEGGQKRRERRLVAPVPLVALAPGLKVSKIIRGCWQLSGRHAGDPYSDRTRGGEAVADMALFHRAGMTSLDAADSYGPAETLIGQYLRLYPWDAPSTTVATKLSYISNEDMNGVSRPLVEYGVKAAAVRMGVQRIDLIQLQWADPDRNRRWLDVLKYLADLREEGLVGAIGLCNFSVPHLAKAVDSGVGIVSNQVSLSLIDRRPLLFMSQAAASYKIKLLAYGTVAGGLLADRYFGAPAGKVRLDTASKQKYGMLLAQAGGTGGIGGGGSSGWAFMQEVLEATRNVAARHGVSAAAVATAWALHQPQVAAAIVGARNGSHVRDLQVAASLVLGDEDMLELDAVWEGVPNPPSGDVYVWERGGAW